MCYTCCMRQQPEMKRVMVIGMVEGDQDDKFTLLFIMGQLLSTGRKGLFQLLTSTIENGTIDVYDMQSHPEKGDAISHLGPDVGLVIAMHLYGIGKMPYKGEKKLHKKLAEEDAIKRLEDIRPLVVYDNNNFYLLQKCMELGIPLIAWGDQPWYKAQNVTDLTTDHSPAKLMIYEPTEMS